MQLALGIIHGIDFALSSWLIGSAVFYCFISGASGRDSQGLLSDWPKKMQIFSVMAFLSSFFWLLFTSSNMAGSWLPNEIWKAMSHTTFGHLWGLKLSFIFLLFLLTCFESKKHSVAFLIFGLTLLLPFFSIFTGHAGVQNDHLLIRVTADWCHSVAVGVWTGGLWMLHVWLGKRLSVAKLGPEVSLRVVTRFSHFAIVSTFVIAVSGLAMAYLAGVSLFQPWSSTYGQWILAKVFFFVAALLAASVNQFVYLRRWTPENDLKFSRGVRREVLLELIFLSVVFVLAGFLARTALP